MSLVSRLSAFFLGSLAAVLIGFSTALYILASQHLHRQVDERLHAALATLAAAAEIGPAGVEWEPRERELGLGRDPGADQIRWVVQNGLGEELDRSANFSHRDISPLPSTRLPSARFIAHDGRPWQMTIRSLAPAAFPSPDDDDRPLASTAPALGSHSAPPKQTLNLIAFASLGPTETTLRWLVLTLAVLSLTVWLLAAVVGRWLCHRALAPLSRMALAARSTNAADPGTRLPLSQTNDELDDMGQAFNGLLDRLHETLERQRRFTGDASHQLRTPLAGLLSQVDVALRRERSPLEYQRVLSLVRSKATQLRQIVESLLFLARAESDSGRPELEPVELAAWTLEHLESWSSHARGADIELTGHVNGPLWVCVHPPLLSQLVDNLLENACKYSESGSPIEIRLGTSSDLVTLTVVDRGTGLTAEEQAKVFQPFYRAPDARNRGQSGVGLGLAVADRITTVFGGSICVQSQPGEGSQFILSLPQIAALPEANSVQREHPSGSD